MAYSNNIANDTWEIGNMSPSVGTKSTKKQPASSVDTEMAESKALEQSLLALEDCCMRILEASENAAGQDMESRTWHQRFENMVSPISLALAECKGPRKFHYHYRRRDDDETILHPVMENALDTLERVCKEALHHCQDDMPGMHESDINRLKQELERCIHAFIAAKAIVLTE
jgi:hypothetical protein